LHTLDLKYIPKYRKKLKKLRNQFTFKVIEETKIIDFESDSIKKLIPEKKLNTSNTIDWFLNPETELN
jgi:hypothetical protein